MDVSRWPGADSADLHAHPLTTRVPYARSLLARPKTAGMHARRVRRPEFLAGASAGRANYGQAWKLTSVKTRPRISLFCLSVTTNW